MTSDVLVTTAKQAFQILRTPCVRLSEIAFGTGQNRPDVRGLEDALHTVLAALQQASKKPGCIDTKLADYVFFPLSHVLRKLDVVSISAKELTLRCIAVLLDTAWSLDLPDSLGIQLIILLTFLAEAQKSGKTQSTEELSLVTMACLKATFSALGTTSEGRNALFATQNIPHVGNCVSISLDIALAGPSSDIQCMAIGAIAAFIAAAQDPDLLAMSYMPGIMSCFTKILTPQASSRRTNKALSACLNVLSDLIPRVMGDSTFRTHSTSPSQSAPSQSQTRNQSWVNATAPQIHAALSNIIKLRSSDNESVRESLARLCTTLLQRCAESLSLSIPMLAETLLMIACKDNFARGDLEYLVTTQPLIGEALSRSLLQWTESLPRCVQSTVDNDTLLLTQKVALAWDLLASAHLINASLQTSLLDALRDTLVEERRRQTTAQSLDVQKNQCEEVLEIVDSRKRHDYRGQTDLDINHSIKALIARLSASSSVAAMLQALLPHTIQLTSSEQLRVNFWLVVESLIVSSHEGEDLTNMINYIAPGATTFQQLQDEAFALSVVILNEPSSNIGADWLLPALALQVVALQARRHKKEFRSELIDILYPILGLLATSQPGLRAKAMNCLDVLSRELGYISTSQMIVDNVDYLANAVILRLNSFDISPEAPFVMVTMVKLAGARLLPFLDDLVDTIFMALDSYHGYERLVQALFAVLKAIIEEACRTSPLPGEATMSAECSKVRFRRSDMLDLTGAIQSLGCARQTMERGGSHPDMASEDLPSRTDWHASQYQTPNSAISSKAVKQEKSQIQSHRIHGLILRTAQLAQNFLSSTSAELRASLLTLLDKAVPLLAKDEETFLPLIHRLWSPLVHRLDDSEAYVVSATLTVIAGFCRHAADFMGTRIDEIWPTLRRLYEQRVYLVISPRTDKLGSFSKLLQSPSKGNLSEQGLVYHGLDSEERHLYIEAPVRLIHKSFMNLYEAVIKNVLVKAIVLEEMIWLFEPMSEACSSQQNGALPHVADAIWLFHQRRPLSCETSGGKAVLTSRHRDTLHKRSWQLVGV